jgi:serine/threonine protein kinase/tetratricopeptide (TPR) repeat protein
MSGTAPEPSTPVLDDPRLVAALEEYMVAVEAGERPDRQAFLARHADVAAALAACLDGVSLVRAGAPRLLPGGADGPAPAHESLLGDFRLVREISRGGMGVVYEAVQVSLGRPVALKVLPFAAALDARQLQRFKNEAQAAAQLHHSNIVPVHAVGSERGVHFYAMQLIDGHSLAAVLAELRDGLVPGQGSTDAAAVTPPQAAQSTLLSARGPAYFRRVAELGVQAAEALEYAHQMGVVHRDVKPANLLVDTTGRLWVTDFGLARCQAGPGVTRTGDVVGTLRYMSPEQALSRHGLIDHRSDVYSLGATLYEALTLRPPYPGRDREQLLRQLAQGDPPPPRRHNAALPGELETIVLKAMRPEPEKRYATAQELADDLRRFLEHRPIKARPPGPGERAAKWARRHRPLVAAAAAVVLLGAAASAVSTVLVWQAKRQTEAALAEARKSQRRAEENFESMHRGTMALLLRLEDRRWDDVPRIQELRRDVVREGLEFYKQFLHDDSPDPALRFQTARTYRQMALVYCSQQRAEEAQEVMRRAVALYEALEAGDPQDPTYPAEQARTLYLRGLLYTSTKRYPEAAAAYDRAAECFRRAVAHEPADDAALNALAWLLAERPDAAGRRPVEAVAWARQAVARSPETGKYWNTLGVADYRAGDWPAAVAALSRSMELRQGGDALDWYFLAMCNHRLGKEDEARTWYKRAAAWLKKHWPPDEDLYRASQEAAELLGQPAPGTAPP